MIHGLKKYVSKVHLSRALDKENICPYLIFTGRMLCVQITRWRARPRTRLIICDKRPAYCQDQQCRDRERILSDN